MIDAEFISCLTIFSAFMAAVAVRDIKERRHELKAEKARHSQELRQRVAQMEIHDDMRRYRMFRKNIYIIQDTTENPNPIRTVKGVFAREYAEHEEEFWNGTYAALNRNKRRGNAKK